MKVKQLSPTFATALVLATLMFVLISSSSMEVTAQNIGTGKTESVDSRNDNRLEIIEVMPKAGQITRQTIETPKNYALSIINYNVTPADVDLVAFDLVGNEVGRETITIKVGENTKINLRKVFANLSLKNLSTVEIQTSVLSEYLDAGSNNLFFQYSTTNAIQLSVGFFSQRQSPWNSYKLGTCQYDTIGSAGCAITSIAMAMTSVVRNLDPGVLNTYLKNNNGYASGCLVKWANAADIDGTGGFKYYGSSTVGTAANLKSLLDNGKFSVVKSARFNTHWAVIIGYRNSGTKLSDFYYLDPWDLTATFRYVGDGFVSSSSTIQIYK